MSSILSWLGVATGRVFALFERLNPSLTLVVWSVLCGLAILLVFRLTSRPESIRKAKRRLYGLLLEMWLHGDEPALVWRAQRALIAANARYLGLLLVPILVVTPICLIMWIHLDQLIGQTPVRPGQTTVLTVQFDGSQNLEKLAPRLALPEGFSSDTPALRALSDGQVSWRVRAIRDAEGTLQVGLPGATLDKRIVAGTGVRYLSGRRGHCAVDLLEHPGEAALPDGPVKWIEVRYPGAERQLFGTEWPWEAWFLILASVTALLFRKRFGVTF